MIDNTKSTKKWAQRRRRTASKETVRRRLLSFNLKKAAQLARKQGLVNKRLEHVGSPMAVALDATLAAHVKDITKVTMQGQVIKLPAHLVRQRMAKDKANKANITEYTSDDTASDTDYEGSESDSPSLHPVLSQHRLNKRLDAAANGQRAAHGPARHPGADDETPLHIASHDDDSDHANDMEWEQADTNANAAVDAFDTQAQAETDFFALLSDNDLMADFASLQTSDQRFLIKDRAQHVGKTSEFMHRTIFSLTDEEKQGQFVVLLQCMGRACRALREHQTQSQSEASRADIMQFGDRLMKLHKQEKGAWTAPHNLTFRRRASRFRRSSLMNHGRSHRSCPPAMAVLEMMLLPAHLHLLLRLSHSLLNHVRRQQLMHK